MSGLREFRHSTGVGWKRIKQRELAILLGVSRNTIQRIESGETKRPWPKHKRLIEMWMERNRVRKLEL